MILGQGWVLPGVAGHAGMRVRLVREVYLELLRAIQHQESVLSRVASHWRIGVEKTRGRYHQPLRMKENLGLRRGGVSLALQVGIGR